MAETGAAFGGEHSAHYYFRDNYRADSGIIAALVVLEQLARPGVPLSELRKPFERYAASGEINTAGRRPGRGHRAGGRGVRRRGQQDRLDGLTVDAGDWWFNLRPSNTEPLLRLNLEAARPRGVRRARRRGPGARSPSPERRDIDGPRPPAPRVLACPEDKGPLLYFDDEDALYNPRLQRRYAIRDDIPSC